MSQISLSASMRSNLLSLQGTSQLMSQTQERLSTGKKVNSAIDNANAYYTAQSLSNRAGDLSALLDDMGQAVSTIKAANEGIEAITSFVEQAKAVATSALSTTDGASRKVYMDQFNDIRSQIDKLAADSGYKGINLLGGTSVTLTVTFNEGRTNQLEISGVDASTTGLSIAKAAWGVETATTGAVTVTDGKVQAEVGVNGILLVGTDYYQWTGAAITKGDDGGDVGAEHKATVDMSKAVKLVKGDDNKYYNFNSTTAEGNIKASVTLAINAINTLRDDASKFGNNYSIVQTRQSFTENLINVLEEGADSLTLADMNEESANMLALQTRQQLAINSLSLASQASQSVLRLFS
jgi:flagellin-like hook-associated protein FlgL